MCIVYSLRTVQTETKEETGAGAAGTTQWTISKIELAMTEMRR